MDSDIRQLTRRGFLEIGGAAAASCWTGPAFAAPLDNGNRELQDAIARLEYLTPLDRAFILDKGKADVGKLSMDALREIGQTPETWTLEAVADPASNSVVDRSFTIAGGNAFRWTDLMELARAHALRFLHVCTCTNGTNPFHMSLWEGVPLREVIRAMAPRENVRRVYYESYHKPGVAPFLSSLPLGRILETPPGELPPVLAYKMNDEVIPASHGGPVRMFVPGAYGSKSIKWLRRIVLTNDFKANDSDADLNNDPENALKTRARFINEPKERAAGRPIPLTGFAQVGVSGLARVQYSVRSAESPWPAEDPYGLKAAWCDATILPPPQRWGGGLRDGKLPAIVQVDSVGAPRQWPLPYTIVHWAALVPALKPGRYELCCRTIDGNGLPQPLPRTLPRTGFNTLHVVPLVVTAP